MKPEDLSEEHLKKLHEEFGRRILSIRSVTSKDTIMMEWKNLLEDEPSRAHFLRLVTTVACNAEVLDKCGYPGEEAKAVYEGAKAIVRLVTRCSVAHDVNTGKMKL